MRIDTTAPRAQTSRLALLASAALFSLPSSAQPASAPAYPADREIAISDTPGERPPVVYGAPEMPLVLSFDAPLASDATVAVQGAAVGRHPFTQNAIVITPSRSLAAAQSPVPVVVPLADGVVDLMLAFSPERRDARVRIVRRASSPRLSVTEDELRELLSPAARDALDSGTCSEADATAVPRRVKQGEGEGVPGGPLVCGGGAFAYLSVMAGSDCAPVAARLTHGEESAEVLLVQAQPKAPHLGTRWLVLARAPPGDGRGFALELLAEDGAACQHFPVNLKPSSP